MNHCEVRSALCSIGKKGHIFRKLNTGDGDYDNCGIVDGGDAEFHSVLCSLGQSVRERERGRERERERVYFTNNRT